MRLDGGPDYGQCLACGRMYDIQTKEALPPKDQPVVPGIRGQYRGGGRPNISHAYCKECMDNGRAYDQIRGRQKQIPRADRAASHLEMWPEHAWWRPIGTWKKKQDKTGGGDTGGTEGS